MGCSSCCHDFQLLDAADFQLLDVSVENVTEDDVRRVYCRLVLSMALGIGSGMTDQLTVSVVHEMPFQ